MSGSTDLTLLVSTLQDANRLAAAMIQQLSAGVGILATWPSYTVASLPVTAAVPTFAYASDGRKPGEGAGLGTGVPVFFDISNVWFSFCDGTPVVA